MGQRTTLLDFSKIYAFLFLFNPAAAFCYILVYILF